MTACPFCGHQLADERPRRTQAQLIEENDRDMSLLRSFLDIDQRILRRIEDDQRRSAGLDLP